MTFAIAVKNAAQPAHLVSCQEPLPAASAIALDTGAWIGALGTVAVDLSLFEDHRENRRRAVRRGLPPADPAETGDGRSDGAAHAGHECRRGRNPTLTADNGEPEGTGEASRGRAASRPRGEARDRSRGGGADGDHSRCHRGESGGTTARFCLSSGACGTRGPPGSKSLIISTRRASNLPGGRAPAVAGGRGRWCGGSCGEAGWLVGCLRRGRLRRRRSSSRAGG